MNTCIVNGERLLEYKVMLTRLAADYHYEHIIGT